MADALQDLPPSLAEPLIEGIIALPRRDASSIAARDGVAMEEILSTLSERGLVPPAYAEVAPLAVWAMEHLYKRNGDALNERLSPSWRDRRP